MTDTNDDPINDFDTDTSPNDDLVMDDLAQKNTLADLWNSNPMVKVVAVLGVLALLVGAMVLFGGSEEAPQSVVGGAQDVKEAPGTNQVTPSMAEAMQDYNDQMIEDAMQTGGSAIPVPINPTISELPAPDAPGEDPLAKWREVQDQQQTMPPVPQQVGPTADPNAEAARQQALGALAGAMSSQMEKILEVRRPGKISSMNVTTIDQQQQAGANGLTPVGLNGAPYDPNMQQTPLNTVKVLLSAGTIEYGQLLLEANTDAPGPVLAQLVTGPFAGGRVIGTFTNTDNYLVLNFNTLVKDAVNYPINAVAVDPQTTLPGMVTDIDRRYFQRIVLPAAARFVEGMGRAIADSGSNTTIIIDGETRVEEDDSKIDTRQELYNGVEEGAREFADFLEEEGDDTEPLIRVASGTPLGIFFTQPVTQTLDAQGNPVQPGLTQPNQTQQQGNGFFPGFGNQFGQQQPYGQAGGFAATPYGALPGFNGAFGQQMPQSSGYQTWPPAPVTQPTTPVSSN
ncbi:MAG: hypothetical protein V4621_01805 [Pseudomonadota bacterium]